MAKEREYQRLPGRAFRRYAVAVAVRSRLWLGKDHLLLVDSPAYSEDYKRFYFRDIQAVTMRKTATGKIINIILATVALFPLLGAFSVFFVSPRDIGLAIFWASIASFFLIFVLINSGFGPTCVCEIRTAVQTEEIPSLRRLWRARKVLRRIRPLILEAQGPFPAAATAAAPAGIPTAQPVFTGSVAGAAPASSSQGIDPLQPPPGT